jgi:hypothetical protein
LDPRVGENDEPTAEELRLID